jgi:GT2 family glycosyltransferase
LEKNLGWSGGNNAGIRRGLTGGADFVCLLNNDTVLPERALDQLRATAATLGPCLLHPAIDSYGDDPLVQLDPAIPIPSSLVVKPVENNGHLFEIDVVNGACLLVHRAVFETIGLIDERFFLLCEDSDFARRAVKAGYHMFCDASVRIQHKESRSFGGRRTPIKTYYGFRNCLLYYEKHEHWRDFKRLAKGLAWMAWGTAEAAGVKPRSWWGVLRFSCSGDPFARAWRMGVRDYALRRFGPINTKDGSSLANASGFGLGKSM